MDTPALNQLLASQQTNQSQISSLQSKLSTNQTNIQQAEADKLAALRTKNQTASDTAQFTIDSLQQENTDLTEQIQELKTTRPTQDQTDAAWKSDLIENSDFQAEMTMLQTAAAFYNAVCARAKREESDWAALACSLDILRTGGGTSGRKYWGPSPSANLRVLGYGHITKDFFQHDQGDQHTTFDSASIDRLIGLLQSIKQNGVDSIL